ncbi:MAG TPA: Hsp70 family protein [Pseudonocardiaceae bacterium]|nr:Hsp70 family protein [Pseudonocardiaceae bacterium]
MSYWLGIDVGSTFIAAAVCRRQPDGGAHLEVVSLGAKSDVVRSVVYLGTAGEVVVGEAAERRAGADPDRVVRAFTRGIGEDVPLVIDGVEYSAPVLTASVVRWVVDRVAQREGGPAQGITVTHPASWEAGKVGAMADALDAAGLPQVALCSGPQAAAISYSIREPLDIGATVAVYDLGGGTFDTAVVCNTGETTFSVLGVPEGIDGVGGTDFDDAVFGHVLVAVPAVSEQQPDTTARMRRSYALCRRECTEAKEALSVDTEVTIPVLLPHVQSQVSMTRAEFDDLIRPQITETVDALRRTLASAGLGPADLDAVLVVGGSARIPLVADLLEAGLGRPVVVDADPQVAMAVGAAMSGFAPGAAGIDDATTEMDVHAASSALAPVGAPASPAPEPGHPESHEPPWLAATGLDATGLDATGLDVEAPDPNWRPASSGRFARLAAAGLFGLVLAGAAVSAPFIMTSHRGTDSTPAGIPAPEIPAGLSVPAPQPPAPVAPEARLPMAQPPMVQPQAPDAPVATVAAIPAPNAGSGDNRNPLNADSTRGVATAPAASNKPLNSAARSKAPPPPAPRTGANRSPAPVATTAAPPPPVPDWVTRARS